MKLRDYQNDAIEAIYDWWKTNKGLHPVLVAAVGAGKTVIMAALIQRLQRDYPGVKILLLAHRKELLCQAEEKLIKIAPELTKKVGIYSASLKRKEVKPVTIAARDTIIRALDKLGVFDLIFIDEAHNISEKEETGYQKIIAHFTRVNPKLSIVGVTATPWRMKGGAIYGEGRLFHGACYEVNMKELIDRGFLCRLVAKRIDEGAKADLTGVKITAGDYNGKDLANRYESPGLIRATVTEWENIAVKEQKRQATLFFCASVEHAKMIAKEINNRAYKAVVIHGNTDPEIRTRTLEEFTRGEVDVICNVAVLTEGTDLPITDCIALATSTRSSVRFIQICGRGMRLYDGKKDCLLLDMGRNLEFHGCLDQIVPKKKRSPISKVKDCPKCGEILPFFAVVCSCCGERFAPIPVKRCPECDEPNKPNASKCVSCGCLLVSHETNASTMAVFSDDENSIQELTVEKITTKIVETKGGSSFLVLAYHCGELQIYYKRLYLGYKSKAGFFSRAEWIRATKEETPIPWNAEKGHELAEASDIWRPIKKIKIDPNDKFNPIKRIFYVK
ncbi:DEAD/DEAH box helicase [Shewanella sp. KX20019]|uniref:DEAD/DEAH box helicase n=1 Tax=Shewanella sp. KX20019 TaxID=2803864 RepID=UPI0019260EF4|nr:DEAD/DEAH box helicase [Shewanella sp. KX20019]QQX80829.1 DEAD/DEAH box helicase [Shewanella sp. KX20019]